MLLFFACTLFVSATLLFLVQPMVGKMVLPSLGGTPAVWNTCMVFFQGVLLVGYGYTHTLSTWQSRRRQLLAQLLILALPFLVLPFSLGNWAPPADHNPAQAVLWLLLGMVGLPFFVVATSAPLLQRWFATTGHPAAKDPYFLYGASNLGSMLALLLYPVFIEPNFDLDTQTLLWTVGYGVLVAMVAGCGLIVWNQAEKARPILLAPASADEARVPVKAAAELASAVTAGKPLGRRRLLSSASLQTPVARSGMVTAPVLYEVTLGRRLRWIGLAAAPVSLMLGVTTYLTTDIAAIPFIWIIPLALYLLTFILVFARWPVPWVAMPHTILVFVQPWFLMFLVLVMIANLALPTWFEFSLHLLAFFTMALVCHGELAKDRPPARQLTDFYLCMSIGGVLGGMFNALVAPQLFWLGVTEYYLAMVLACCLRPNTVGSAPLIPGDSSQENETRLGRVLNIVVPIGTGVMGFFLVKFGAELHWALAPYAIGVGLAFMPVLALGLSSWLLGSHWEKKAIILGGGSLLIITLAIGFYLGLETGTLDFKSYVLGVTTVLIIALPVGFVVAAWVGEWDYSSYFIAFGVGLVIALFIGYFLHFLWISDNLAGLRKPFFLAVGAVLVLALAGRSLRFGLSLGCLILGVFVYDRSVDPLLFEDRSFFGFVKVRASGSFPLYHTLVHGGINHGSQIIEPKSRRRETITYFHPTSGVGQIFKKFSWPDVRLPASLIGLGAVPGGVLAGAHSEPPYAVVGLGTGILAAHAKPWQHMVFYEIDPLVMRLSVPPEGEDPFFYYVQDARDRGANLEIILGDGRLTLQKDPRENPFHPGTKRKLDHYYHIIVVDAFSSDAIPVHLLTAEAIDLYLAKLAPGGVLVFNVTNKYLDLRPVLGKVAEEKGLTCLYYGDGSKDEEGNVIPDKFASDWIVMQRKDYAKGWRTVNGGPPLAQRVNMERWQPVAILDGPVWTDKYSNMLRVMDWGR